MPRALATLALALALALALVLAGCGGGTNTITVNGPPKNSSAGTTAKQRTTRASTKPTIPTPERVVRLGTFQTPSGNIGCMILDGVARCDIVERSWSPPPRPADCPEEVDFGQGLEIGSSGGARFVCAGDTSRDPRAPKLAYGDAARIGDFECVSEQDGLTCSRGNGHGFFLSIQSYRVF